MQVRTLADLSEDRLRGRRILVRVDFNVPMGPSGGITDDTRIVSALPTLVYILERGGRPVVMSHLGRPKGGPDPAFSLRPVAERLASLLPFPVRFSAALTGREAEDAAAALGDGELVLLENTRFSPGETQNDPGLSEALGALGDLYVNDAFGSAHRAHASTVGAAESIRRRGGEVVAGFLMERELKYLGMAVKAPERPFVAVLGGAKISGKIDVIHALLPKVDRLLIGGAMANTFFRAMGLETGRSLVEEDRIEMAMSTLREAGETILLPVDCLVADEIAAGSETRSVGRGEVGPRDCIGDIGQVSRTLFAEAMAGARTVVWNGPMGVFEVDAFSGGTLAVAEAVAAVTEAGGTTIVGGGDSVAAAQKAGVSERLTHVSTGGGASLEFLAGSPLPGVAVLDPRSRSPE